MAGLRQRKKAAAIHHIHQVAVTLFREHGFDAVTIEQVAEAAEVSPSTIYRYFGTKEGLVFRDEFDDQLRQAFSAALAEGAPLLTAAQAALGAIATDHFEHDKEITRFRTQLWAQHRGVQAAAAAHLMQLCEELAQEVASAGRLDLADARVVMSALIHGFVAAIVAWHEDGGTGTPEPYILRGLAQLKAALGQSDPIAER